MNKNIVLSTAFGIFSLCMLSSCQKQADAKSIVENISPSVPVGVAFIPDQQWNDYWYQGLAELTSYTLKQSRYGEIHTGSVVHVFVTEDFSKSKQVKLDYMPEKGDEKISVLKLNQSIKFNTGVYPYSIMMSAFNAVDMNQYAHAIKTNTSVQEWCGMASFQLNQKDNQFVIEQRSYFENEGDKNVKLDIAYLEDEIWNLIRLNYKGLPIGTFTMLPGGVYLRLNHKVTQSIEVVGSLKEENNLMVYTIEMKSLGRVLAIQFEKSFPYQILRWDDTYPGIDGKTLTTTAIKNKQIMLDYWSKHTNGDLKYREMLGLPELYQ